MSSDSSVYIQNTHAYKRETEREKTHTASRASTSALKPKSSFTRSSRPSLAATSSARSPPAQRGARASARARTHNCLAAQRRRHACGGCVGVGAGLQEAIGILVLAQLHLCDERGLARERVLAFERRGPGARDEEALEAVLCMDQTTQVDKGINCLSSHILDTSVVASPSPTRTHAANAHHQAQIVSSSAALHLFHRGHLFSGFICDPHASGRALK
jgi:hypothetical protein